MALIKKYDTGGSFKDYVNERMLKGDLPLTTKSWDVVQKGLETFDENISADPNNAPKKNWAGQYVVTPETVNAFLSTLNQESKQAVPKTTALIPEGGRSPVKRSIGNLIDYISKTDYSDNQDYALQQLAKKDNPEIKKSVVQKGMTLLDKYIQSAEANPSETWEGIDNIKKIRNELSSIDPNKVTDEDWEKFASFTNQLGWQPEDFLIPDKVIQERAKAKEVEKEAQAKTSLYDTFKSSGISDETQQNNLYQSGYRKPADNLDPNLSKYFTDKGYNVFSDESGKNYRVLKGNEFVPQDNGLLSTDQLNENYGKAFVIQNGVLQITDKLTKVPEWLSVPEFTDEGNIGKGIYTDDPKYKGYNITGFSKDDLKGVYGTDIFGRRDYTKQLRFTDPQGKSFNVTRGDDNKYYLDSGEEFQLPKLTGFSGAKTKEFENIEETYFKNPASIFKGIQPKQYKKDNYKDIAKTKGLSFKDRILGIEDSPEYNFTLQDAEKSISEFEQKVRDARNTGNLKDLNQKKFKRLVENVAYFIRNSDDKELAKKLALRLQSVGSERLDPNNANSPLIFNFKQGGVLKAQEGMSFAELAKKKNRLTPSSSDTSPSGSTPSENNQGKIFSVQDVSNAWRNASDLQKWSVIASGVSVLPAIGVFGGAASTVLDFMEDKKDGLDKEDYINLASNLGFTALSLVGLGAAKGAGLIGKASKVVKTAKTAKVLKGAEEAKNLAKAEQLAKQVQKKNIKFAEDALDHIKKLDKKGLLSDKSKESVEAANRIVNAAKEGKNVKIDPADLEKVKELSQLKTTWVGAKTEGAVEGAKAVGKFMVEKAPLVGKAAKLGLVAQTGIAGTTGVIDIAKNVREEGWEEGLGNTDINSIKNVLRLGSVTFGGVRNKINTKAADRNLVAVKGTPETTTITLGDKNIKITGKLKAGKKSEDKKQFLEELLKGESVNKGDKKVIEKYLNSGDLKKVKLTSSKANVEAYELREKPLSDRYNDIEDWLRTKKRIEKGAFNYSNPRRLFKPRFEATLNKPQSEAAKAAPDIAKVQEAIKKTKTVKANSKNFKKTVSNKKGNLKKTRAKTPTKHQLGGILKLQNSGIIPSLYTLSNKSVKLPQLNPINLSYQNPISTTPKYTLPNQYVDQNKYPYVTGVISGKPIQKGTGTGTGTGINSTIAEYTPIPFTPKKYTDIWGPIEALRLGINTFFNKKAIGNQIKAVAELPTWQTASKTHIPTNMSTANRAFELAAKASQAARGIAGSTSDIDKSLAVRLAGVRQASDIERTGLEENLKNNAIILGQQLESDARVDATNKDIANRAAQLAAQARGNVYKLQSNLDLYTSAGLQDYLSNVGRESNLRPYRKALWDYNQVNPNVSGLQEYIDNLSTVELPKAQKVYEDYWASVDPAFLWKKPAFKDSDEYKAWKKRVDDANQKLKLIYADKNAKAALVNTSMPMAQKGGRIPLSEKVALENVKFNHKRLLKNDELFYKQLMENTKLVQKALIKVFK